MLLADKVLKHLGKEKAKDKYKVGVVSESCLPDGHSRALNIFPCAQNREPMMPSPQFIKSYFSSFTDDIISKPLQKGEKKDEDKDKEGEAAEVTGR